MAPKWFTRLIPCVLQLIIRCRRRCERSTVQVYPYIESDPCGPVRTQKETCERAAKAVSRDCTDVSIIVHFVILVILLFRHVVYKVHPSSQ